MVGIRSLIMVGELNLCFIRVVGSLEVNISLDSISSASGSFGLIRWFVSGIGIGEKVVFLLPPSFYASHTISFPSTIQEPSMTALPSVLF